MPFKRTSNWTPESIEDFILQGKSMSEIAKIYGLTRQRIKQICVKHNLSSSLETKAAIRNNKYFSKWGTKTDTDLYHVCRTKYSSKKAFAKANAIPWDISFGSIDWPQFCPIFGIPLNYFAGKTEEGSPSFDRVNPNMGYVQDNVRIVSWRANRIKNDGSASEHRSIADYLDNIAKSP